MTLWRPFLGLSRHALGHRTCTTHGFCTQTFAAALEGVVQEDPGQRGIAPLITAGELASAAHALSSADVRSVAILTGYPCCLAEPPTETDGPLGALAIARALVAAGKRAAILTDLCNEAPVRAGLAASNAFYGAAGGALDDGKGDLPVLAFDGGDILAQAVADDLRLDAIVAIERPGPARDGKYYTMRGRDMTQSAAIARLEQLLSGSLSHNCALSNICSPSQVPEQLVPEAASRWCLLVSEMGGMRSCPSLRSHSLEDLFFLRCATQTAACRLRQATWASVLSKTWQLAGRDGQST